MIRPDTSNVMANARSSNNRQTQKTIFGILTATGFKDIRKNGRIQVGRKFENPIPEGSAKEAQQEGPWKSPWAEFPGIPTNKYTWAETAAKENCHNWIVEHVYHSSEIPSPLSTYEGWNSTATYSHTNDPDFEKDNTTAMDSMRFRDTFLQAIKAQATTTMEMREAADRWLNMKVSLMETPENMFWLYEDLTHYHTKIHMDYGLTPMYYMCLRKDLVEPPSFKYSCFNIVDHTAFKAITEGKATKALAEIQKTAKKTKVAANLETSCENPEQCQCNQVHHYLYSKGVHDRVISRHNLVPNKDSLLDLRNFRQLDTRIVIECSDSCGCSPQCPRRRLQQGQKKRCVVFYENGVVDFGLRAAEKIKKGEFICEYIGLVRILKDDDGRDGSYDAALTLMTAGKQNEQLMVIDSSDIGNMSRFMSHACSPSSALIETHSRVFESDPLIPRISVYALKDINVGEKVTISYYQESQLKTGKGIPCGCREDCPNHLPKN